MDKKNKWYNSANSITNIIMLTILLIIVFSQSFVLGENSSIKLFTSIINHNSIYLCVLVYFILLKLPAGKKYFNYLSVFLIFIYFIISMTSLLTMIQSFNLTSVLSFILYFLLLIYLVHTLLRDTRVWREFYLSSSPFNELSNDFMFYSILIVSIILLAVNLIDTVYIGGIIMPILDTIFIILFSRYIYLYRMYLDKIKKEGSDKVIDLDQVKTKLKEVDKKVSNTVDEIGKNISDYAKEKEIDKKIDKARDVIVDASKEASKELSKIVEDTKKDIKKATSKKKGDK